ncbi:MAG: LysM peptidoglycan-binding domain-containing protein [Endomicrobiia bacterium]|nr:LysM peptidoglycan-binding domain-containing protein [Endomicrobiia bacterium]
MKITKLHLILLIVALGGFFAWKEYARGVEIARQREELERARREEKSREEIEARKRELEAENLAKKATLSREAIAVAGEILKIARRENLDAAKGRATLRAAKKTLAEGDPHKAWELARQSIKELKETAFGDKIYAVKSGDNLWDIARMRRHFSDGRKWPYIYLANKSKIKNPRVIYPRQRLVVPVSNWEQHIEAAKKIR